MGKVRTSLVKRTARKLIVMYPNLFTIDFEHNKQIVSKLCIIHSKKLRNQIAGYITHLVKIMQRQASEEGSEID
ncbi:MAG: 30S ribosomal protein S17e [Desulfurococcaceae archaeon]|jgi:small subunit ribosomal protein S17e|nr:30S ribosomal protein S17e [Desulfurococcaceae archaeon]